MKKEFVICICAVAIGLGGWLGAKEYGRFQARKSGREQAAATVVAAKHLAGEKANVTQENQLKARRAEEAAAAARKEKMAAERKQVEAELGACKLSSIMLGTPSIAIIDKKGYEAGGQVPLAGGRMLTVSSIDADAVQLTDGQQAYRLALPKARDLEASGR